MRYDKFLTFAFLLFLGVMCVGTLWSVAAKLVKVHDRSDAASTDTLSVLVADKGLMPANQLSLGERLDAVIAEAEEQFAKNAAARDLYTECFGGLQRLLGRQSVESEQPGMAIVRLTNGQYSFVELGGHSSHSADEVARLRDVCEQYGARFIYFNRPGKVMRGTMPRGLRDVINDASDTLVAELLDAGVETVDLRQSMPVAGDEYARMFYVTDNHWRLETALAMAKVVAQAIGADTSVYETGGWGSEVVPRPFYGSLALRAGAAYFPSADVMTIPLPPGDGARFKVSAYSYKMLTVVRQGGFFEAMFDTTFLYGKGKYVNRYAGCLGGDHPLISIDRLGSGGKRVLLFGDSFSLSFGIYLALSLSHLDIVDLRSYRENDLEQRIARGDYDCVICLYPNDVDGTQFTFFR